SPKPPTMRRASTWSFQAFRNSRFHTMDRVETCQRKCSTVGSELATSSREPPANSLRFAAPPSLTKTIRVRRSSEPLFIAAAISSQQRVGPFAAAAVQLPPEAGQHSRQNPIRKSRRKISLESGELFISDDVHSLRRLWS